MGIAKRLKNWVLGQGQHETKVPPTHSVLRRCHFEIMEPRRVLSADPVVVGVTYHEGDTGQDTTPDHFEVTFQGGSAATKLTTFTINGDQDLSGTLTDGDMFFDYSADGPGAGGFHPFQFDAANSRGLTADDIEFVRLENDGLSLTVGLRNFEAGDKLAFTIDVDEVERFLQDKIASGVEFEGTFFTSTFVDENYTFSRKEVTATTLVDNRFQQTQTSGIFYDYYDDLIAAGNQLAGTQLDLRSNHDGNQGDRSAASIDVYELVPKPISISGSVYHDENLNCERDANEHGISGVRINLQRMNEATGRYEQVASTLTDGTGRYEFGTDLNLLPGTYRVIEVQPAGYLDVAASAGTVSGQTVGNVRDNAQGHENILTDIVIPLGGNEAIHYDFKEVLPASIAGTVWHDRNDDGRIDSGEEGIADVLVRVTRLGAKDSSIKDPFAGTESIYVRTDANGRYSVDGLPPGIYEVVEVNNYPTGVDPLATFIDGRDAVGTINGRTVGTGFNDRVTQIELCAGDAGVDYNFGELRPSSINGYVSVTTPEGLCVDPMDPRHEGIAGVTLQLLDDQGNLVATTQTDANGFYEFSDLRNGTYSVVQVQPNAYLDGAETLGKVDGVLLGRLAGNDRFDGIQLSSGQAGTMYNFCELRPASIAGTVYADADGDCVFEPGIGDEPIAGVTLVLLDQQGNELQRTVTDVDGNYRFEGLRPGTYTVREITPAGYLDGGEFAGQVGSVTVGTVTDDRIAGITLLSGSQGTRYDFCEHKPAQISGYVHVDADGDCVYEPGTGDQRLSGVTLELLDASGNVLAVTTTNANGFYQFSNLLPGKYSIRQQQPEGMFDLGTSVGVDQDGNAGPGTVADGNRIIDIQLRGGQRLEEYNFCEVLPAEIAGRVWEDGPRFETEDGLLPANYRSQRDGVFQAGVDTPLAGVTMRLYYYIDPQSGSLSPRAVTLADVLPGHYQLGGDLSTPITAITDANGEYRFTGLKAGNYIVVQEQPDGFVDANDMVGSTTGFSYNSELEAQFAPQSVISTFSTQQIMDSVVNIRVNGGGISVQNNFTEVRVAKDPGNPFNPWNPPPQPPQPPGNPVPPGAPQAFYGGLAGSQPGIYTRWIGTSHGAAFQMAAEGGQPYSWHLSVVNAGQPRAVNDAQATQPSMLQAAYLSAADWNRFEMNQGTWSFAILSGDTLEERSESWRFGTFDGIPMAGDFDGDGIDEIAIFRDGYWMIDLNRNGQWDQNDLFAKLGESVDDPVVGDWDGDGKEDIGIYGPIWEMDPEAISREPGLPNPDNRPDTLAKNVPPAELERTNGTRVMRLTAFSKQRVDVIDHVFGIDDHRMTPVTGDWNGNGIRSIGTFENGTWRLDINGDGRFDGHDVFATFGQAGDVPMVGDFNGDGIEQIAVYRSGTWIIDSNNNRQLDDQDLRIEYGQASDRPVVGDWNGDGIDDLGLYREDIQPMIEPTN